jgi:hypothetical protein
MKNSRSELYYDLDIAVWRPNITLLKAITETTTTGRNEGRKSISKGKNIAEVTKIT